MSDVTVYIYFSGEVHKVVLRVPRKMSSVEIAEIAQGTIEEIGV